MRCSRTGSPRTSCKRFRRSVKGNAENGYPFTNPGPAQGRSRQPGLRHPRDEVWTHPFGFSLGARPPSGPHAPVLLSFLRRGSLGSDRPSWSTGRIVRAGGPPTRPPSGRALPPSLAPAARPSGRARVRIAVATSRPGAIQGTEDGPGGGGKSLAHYAPSTSGA